MNQESKQHEHEENTQPNTQPDRKDNALERLAKLIDPPGREVPDEDLKDPGRMTPGQNRVDNRS